jgi:pilus assembly protein CpaC
LLAVAITALLTCSNAYAFQQEGETINVTSSTRDIEVVSGASQPLKFEFPIPKLMVQVPEVIDAAAIAADEVLITGLKPGISKLIVVDENGKQMTLTIAVKIDVRILQRAIDKIFPTSQVKVDALSNKVVLSGYVADSEQVTNILELANDYFPVGVINNVRVAKSPNVAIQVKIYEVSRSKLRRLGVDWAYFGQDGGIVSSVSDIIQSAGLGAVASQGEDLAVGYARNGRSINAFIQALERHNVAKLLDEPVLVAKDGRPAEFLSGGEFPIATVSGLGQVDVEFKPFGTKLDVVPIILGRNRLTLEIRAEVSEVDTSISSTIGSTVPGFRVRRVNTAVDMAVGHTLALAGDYREEMESTKQGVPGIFDHPLWGAAFRKVEEQRTETELVFLLTPRFIDAVEAHEIKRAPVGYNSWEPSDKEFYNNGHLEVPRCHGDNCTAADGFRAIDSRGVHAHGQVAPEAIPYYQEEPAIPVAPTVGEHQPQPKARQAAGFAWPSK